ncbi:DUF2147 domain-containing protein [Phenylobacterium sp.]|uniref:DUF2147 domain-containing protein n=1 Tax=Phenylobacterium sp. TaxID=1871053 RepID=UPI0028119CE2|nr:DUF2147 domain-containing protein [Phenylobacterium sp.]
MRPILLAAAASLLATPAFAADPVEGEWLTQAGTAKVRIAPCAGKADRLCGTVVWLKNAGAKDANNPDPKLRDRAIVGMNLIRDFKQAGPGRWTGGKIYDPESGKTYDSKISANANGTLKVEGCVLVVCQAQTWRRG